MNEFSVRKRSKVMNFLFENVSIKWRTEQTGTTKRITDGGLGAETLAAGQFLRFCD